MVVHVSCINPPPLPSSAQRCGAVTSHRLLRQTGTVFFEGNVACDDATQSRATRQAGDAPSVWRRREKLRTDAWGCVHNGPLHTHVET